MCADHSQSFADSDVRDTFSGPTDLIRGFVIFAYGLFSISAQALVFREFITSFESNDITVGIFFACWFLWVALGAVLVNCSKRLAEVLLRNIEIVFLLYLPAFILQALLIIHIRRLAGIAPYTLLPIPTALFLALLVNAPVSLITGVLFPVICRWVRLGTASAVTYVYLLESSGSFVGGLGTTLLLAYGVNNVRIFLVLALVVSLAGVCCFYLRPRGKSAFRKTGIVAGVLMVLLFAFALFFSVDKPISRELQISKWSRLLPGDSYVGSFNTTQAEYLYGAYQGQWIAMREGSVVEAIPDPTSAGRIIALALSQNPQAERILIIGSDLNLCRRFLLLGQIKRLVWAYPDNEYVSRILRVVPPELSISDSRFEPFAGDIRAGLDTLAEQFDLVIVNMPDAASSVSNRYYTLDFFEQLKSSLGHGAVLAVSVPGGENIMGTELVTIGASARVTLSKAFSNIVVVPGDTTWFIACDSSEITGEPGTLREHFASIPDSAEIYPANGLLSIYLPDRAARAMDAYNSADLPARHLLNRDSRPLANLYALLLAAKESDAPVTRLFKYLLLAGIGVFVVPIVVYVVLRVISILGAGDRLSTFDFVFLVFSAGAVGIGVVIVLMYLYQTRFGSLYLYIGAVSSLYMAGLAAGAAIVGRLLRRPFAGSVNYSEIILALVLVAQCAVLITVVYWPAENWSHFAFAVAFVVCGLCSGCYFPIAGRLLAERGLQTTQTAVRLETADHIGAAAGGLISALVLLPVLGVRFALVVLLLVILANLPSLFLRILRKKTVAVPAVSALRAAGFSLFGIAVTVIVCSNMLAVSARRLMPSLPLSAAQALAGQSRIKAITAALPGTGKTVRYFDAFDANDKLSGYIFSSETLAPNIRGFGGKINLAIYTDPAGVLLDFHIIRSNETPAYLDMLTNAQHPLRDWFDSLKGRSLFSAESFADVDAVTGATISSEAIVKALSRSGDAFASGILGLAVEKTAGPAHRFVSRLPDAQGAYLIGVLILTFIVIYRGGFWSRLFILASDVIVGGVVLNAQFSTEQVTSLLSGAIPSALPTGVFILTVGVPLLAVLFGNIYCGYLCPFGALQEFFGYLLPARFKPSITIVQMRKARFVKFVILFIVVVAFFLSRSHDALSADVLIRFFSPKSLFDEPNRLVLFVVVVALFGSIFYSRFWCRYLCPAGAFLSLFNKVALFARYMPSKHFAHCEYGITFNDKLDCIYCDKCRYERKPAPQVVAGPFVGFGVRNFPVAVLVAAVIISLVSVKSSLRELPTPVSAAATATSAGQPRNVDMQKIRTLIRENKLSDHEAEYYKKVE